MPLLAFVYKSKDIKNENCGEYKKNTRQWG